MGRNSDDLEPGRVNVVDIAGSREEITLIFFLYAPTPPRVSQDLPHLRRTYKETEK